MSKMDFSGFKKVRQDDHTATFRHEKLGHELTIARKSLSSKHQTQLDALPVHQFAEGGGVQGVSEGTGNIQDAPPPVAAPVPVDPYPVDVSARGMSAPSGTGTGTAPEMIAEPVAARSTTTLAGPANTRQVVQQEAPDPFGNNAFAAAQTQALGEQAQGQQIQETAKGELGQRRAQAESNYAQKVQRFNDVYASDYENILADRRGLERDVMEGKVNPQKYLQNMSTGSKISTALGLIVGGMGAGLTHGPNLAFQYLQSQIDRDIDAQKTELGKRQNLLSYNMQQGKDLREATEFSRLQMNDIMNSRLRALADEATDPIAKGRILEIAGQFHQKNAEIQHNLSLQKAMMQTSPGQGEESNFQQRMNYLRMNNQAPLAKDMESKHVAGIPGSASVELSATNRSDLEAKANFDQKLADYISFAKQHSGSIDPRISAQGAAKAAELQGLYRQATNGGVYKEGEAHFISQLIDPKPTKFFNNLRGVIPKAQALQQSNLESLNTLKQSLGFPVAHGGAPGSAPGNAAHANFGFKPRTQYAKK